METLVSTELPADQDITLLSSTRVVLDGRIVPGTLVFSSSSGKFIDVLPAKLGKHNFPPHPRLTHHDVSAHAILPGLLDAHVHLNEPGPRTAWEGFETGTQAAISGGVTTVIDMPLNSIPPTVSVAALNEKATVAKDQIWCDVGFYGGVVPSNVGKGELQRLVQAGVRGFKGFLCDSGVPEFPQIGSTEIQLAMHELRDEPTVLMFHAEKLPVSHEHMSDDVQISRPPQQPLGLLHEYRTFLDSRPPDMETLAITEILSLAHLAPHLSLHIVHLSAAECVDLLRSARRKGVKVTSETCHHYLSLTADKVGDGDARYKCCPPIRGKKNQDDLWEELLRRDESVIHTVVSDHSPCTANLKILPAHVPGSATTASIDAQSAHPAGDLFKAWGGVSSLGLGLSILNTQRSQGRTFDLTDVVQWCAVNTAKQVGLQHRKGRLSPGMDADVCVFDEAAEFVLEADKMHFRNKLSPYQGHRFQGRVKETWLAGRRVYTDEHGFNRSNGPSGKLLLERREK